MKKKTILHLIPHTAVGGSQDNTFCTCAILDRARAHVTRFEAGRITRQYEQAILSALSQRQETSKQP